MKRTRNIVFIVELLLLFVILLFVIVTVTRIFMTSRSQSLHARRLTEAVSLAEDIAEVTKNTPDRESAAAMIGMMEEVQEMTGWEEKASGEDSPGSGEDADTLEVGLLFAGDGSQDPFRAEVLREEEETEAGRFVSEHISVFYGNEEEQLYALETGWYLDKEMRTDSNES